MVITDNRDYIKQVMIGLLTLTLAPPAAFAESNFPSLQELIKNHSITLLDLSNMSGDALTGSLVPIPTAFWLESFEKSRDVRTGRFNKLM